MRDANTRYRTRGLHARQSTSAGMMTLGTLVTLLAVAVVMDAQADRRVIVVRSSCILEACRESEHGELERSTSIARKLVEAARDFLGTSVHPAAALSAMPRTWAFSSTAPVGRTRRDGDMPFRDPEVILSLLNIPPPALA